MRTWWPWCRSVWPGTKCRVMRALGPWYERTRARVANSSMILRDPIHGLIAFEGSRERIVHALLRTREVQRLRRVRQLGLASLVFPGAEHSRFAHALGAAHVMGRLLDRLGALDVPLAADQRVDEAAA